MCLVKPVITVSNGNLTLLGNSEGFQPQDHPVWRKGNLGIYMLTNNSPF